ncbi:glycosyltransferase family 87 protein [Cupriavidus basilensis]
MTLLHRRPMVAGMLLGLVTVKPHLAIVLPLALLCAREWRALLGMAGSATALALLSLVCFGVEPFLAFLNGAGTHVPWSKAVRRYWCGCRRCLPRPSCCSEALSYPYVVHAAFSCMAVASVIYAWSRPCSFALRAAVLSLALLLVPPYLYDYDLAFLGLAMAWLGVHAHRCGWLRGEREFLVVLWLLPLYGLLLGKRIGIQLMPIGLIVALALGIWRIRIERRSKA